jgi:hypothetical protein
MLLATFCAVLRRSARRNAARSGRTFTELTGVAVTLYTGIRRAFGSKLGGTLAILAQVFLDFPQSLQATVATIRPRLLPSKLLKLIASSIITPFEAMQFTYK